METLLRSQEPESLRNQVTQPQQQQNSFSAPIPNDALQGMPDISMLPNDLDTQIQSLAQTFGQQPPGQPGLPGADLGFNGEFPWEMVSLGLEEPLPAQDVVDELYVFHNHNVLLGEVQLLTEGLPLAIKPTLRKSIPLYR